VHVGKLSNNTLLHAPIGHLQSVMDGKLANRKLAAYQQAAAVAAAANSASMAP
jgi:hypothetical protein